MESLQYSLAQGHIGLRTAINMNEKLQIGDQVKIFFDEKYGEKSGWYEGRVIKIEPYSEHRSFHWVELTPEAQSLLGIKQISVFNPKNIQKTTMTNSTVISLLEKAIEARQELFDGTHESAFRLFSGFTEGYRELVVDIYGSTLVIHDYAEQPDQPIVREVIDYLQQSLDWLHAGIVKSRNGKTQEDKRGRIVFGDTLDNKIKEHGIWYAVDLAMNRDASLYLDTSALRQWLREHMSGKSVLNAFAYTGSLGVAALAGGASKVIQHDLNRKFLNLAKNSYALNDFPINNKDFIAADFFPTVSRYKTSKQLFDCVIIDPPFFSTTSKGTIDLVNESKRLINKVRPLINNGGILITINNALYLSGKEYMQSLEELCRDGYLKIRELIPVPQHFIGYDNKSAPITDPSPFNHSTKIAILDIKKK